MLNLIFVEEVFKGFLQAGVDVIISLQDGVSKGLDLSGLMSGMEAILLRKRAAFEISTLSECSGVAELA